MAKVLRISFGLGALVVVLAGCGGGTLQDSAAHGIPRAVAHEWETRATAIANAAAAGNSCEAQHLAASLRDDVVSSQRKVPRRLRSALLTGVYSLADHTGCTRVVTVQTPPPTHPTPGPKPKPEPPKPHEPPGHGKGHDNHGGGNNQ